MCFLIALQIRNKAQKVINIYYGTRSSLPNGVKICVVV